MEPPRRPEPQARINEMIRVPRVRLIGEALGDGRAKDVATGAERAEVACEHGLHVPRGARVIRAVHAPRAGAREQVQWTCESDERREPKRAAGQEAVGCCVSPGIGTLSLPIAAGLEIS